MNRRLLLALAAVAATGAPSLAATLPVAEKAALQAAMRQHIDRQLVQGAFMWFDAKAGAVGKLFPTKSHPMILSYGDHFILCADFRDGAGKDVNIDFYVARRAAGFVVFHTAVADRGVVEKLMKEGAAVALD